jgi:triphosphoribosyl-dephospho-CoA synthase
VAACCQAGLLLELATTPKPGLVDRMSRVIEFDKFLVSAVVLNRHFRRAAEGVSVARCIENACRDMLSWQSGGNTHLGAILLLMPVAAAARASRDAEKLRWELGSILEDMSYLDTLIIFRAVRMVKPRGLGRVAFLDVMDERSFEKIARNRITPLKALKPYKEWDAVAHEYLTCYEACYRFGYRYLKAEIDSGKTFNEAGVNTFLNILANMLDTHVARRYGRPAARMLSRMAGRVLEAGSTSSEEGLKALAEFTNRVEKAGYRPASSADILSVAFTLLMLDGWKP